MVALTDVFRRRASACELQEPQRSSSTTAWTQVSDGERCAFIRSTCMSTLSPFCCAWCAEADRRMQMDARELDHPRAATTILEMTRRTAIQARQQS